MQHLFLTMISVHVVQSHRAIGQPIHSPLHEWHGQELPVAPPSLPMIQE